MPGLFPAQYSWEGSALGGVGVGGRNTVLFPCGAGPLFSGPGLGAGAQEREGLHLPALAGVRAVNPGFPSLPISQMGLVKGQEGNSLSPEERRIRACLPGRQQ